MAAARTRSLAWACVAVGVFMASTPFASPLVGTPFDGLPALAWSTDRMLLHVLPGCIGIFIGTALLGGRSRTVLGTPWTWVLVGALAVVGAWDGLGPWLYDMLVPHSGQSGLMFLTIPRFQQSGSVHQVLVKAFCHWVPGMLTVALALAWLCHGVTTHLLRRRPAPTLA